MPVAIFLYEIDKSFGPNLIASYYLTNVKATQEILRNLVEKHTKKDLCDATITKDNYRYYSSEIDAENTKKNLYLGFILKEEEDLVSLKSLFEKIEGKIIENFTTDKRKLEQTLKEIMTSILDLMEKLKEPEIIKQTINEKTKQMLDEGKLQEARELIDLGEKIPEKLAEEVTLAEQYRNNQDYKKAKKSYFKAAELAEQIQEFEMVDLLRKKGEKVGDLPSYLKEQDSINKDIQKILSDLEGRELNLYEEVVGLINENIKISNNLDDNEFIGVLEKLKNYCRSALRKANELNRLDEEILKILEEEF
ncbi:MAG: hypothetical protein GF353_06275 [Candidatus Lokiarchaeota archaeon]|nr:hypothetical protein [Candidatus Lokiarchaeota archaeon]